MNLEIRPAIWINDTFKLITLKALKNSKFQTIKSSLKCVLLCRGVPKLVEECWETELVT